MKVAKHDVHHDYLIKGHGEPKRYRIFSKRERGHVP
jgi:hypothetical protein